jgi:hypothetical protein
MDGMNHYRNREGWIAHCRARIELIHEQRNQITDVQHENINDRKIGVEFKCSKAMLFVSTKQSSALQIYSYRFRACLDACLTRHATPHFSRHRCGGQIGRRTLGAAWRLRQLSKQPLDTWFGSKEVWKVVLKIRFSFPSYFFFSVMVPLDLKHPDCFSSCASLFGIQYSDRMFGIR